MSNLTIKYTDIQTLVSEYRSKINAITTELGNLAKNIQMPDWDFNNPATMEAWDLASGAYAGQVSGNVRAVVGSNLREGNIWENVELPRLKANPNVTRITVIDPKIEIETIIFERR